MKKKTFLAGVGAMMLAASIMMAGCGGGGGEKKAADGGAAWKPTKDVKVIVAYKAGSGTDTGARVLLNNAKQFVGQTLVIENKPGADGKIGWTELTKAKPDGYTIGFINLPTYTTLAIQPGANFDDKSIVPICNHLTETGVVVVKKDAKWKDLKELVADAQANPGVLKASTNGAKASNHTAAQLLAQSAVRPQVRVRAVNMETLLTLCRDGLGACFSPLNLATDVLSPQELSRLRVFHLGPSAQYNISFGYLRKHYQWKVISEFIRMSLESLT